MGCYCAVFQLSRGFGCSREMRLEVDLYEAR